MKPNQEEELYLFQHTDLPQLEHSTTTAKIWTRPKQQKINPNTESPHPPLRHHFKQIQQLIHKIKNAKRRTKIKPPQLKQTSNLTLRHKIPSLKPFPHPKIPTLLQRHQHLNIPTKINQKSRIKLPHEQILHLQTVTQEKLNITRLHHLRITKTKTLRKQTRFLKKNE